jgi:hypothetical protein
MLNKRILAIPAIVGVLVLVGAGLVAASSKDPTYKVCVKAGLVYGAGANGACPAGTRAVLINSHGPIGSRGPKGANGARGAKGANGVARDAGDVYPGTSPIFQKEGLVGWVSVSRFGTGEYCLTPDATSTKANTSLLLSLGGPGGGGQGSVMWIGYCSFNPLELWVLTDDPSGQESNSIPFEAVIPSTP